MSLAHATMAPVAREDARPDSVPWYEQAIVIAGFLILFGTFKVILPGQAEDRTAGSALYQLVSTSIYLSAFALFLVHGIPVWFFRLLTKAWPIVFLTLLMLVSTLWSQAPSATFRRAVALTLGSMFAAYLVGRFDFRKVMQLLAVAFAIFIAVGFLAAAVPGLGVTDGGAYAGAWRGLSGNKNDFARTIALAIVLVSIGAATRLLPWRQAAIGIVGAAFVLLLFSKSATSFTATFASLGTGVFLFVLFGGPIGSVRFRGEVRIVLGILAIVAAVIFVTEIWPLFLEAIGRDPTLTGRTKLWSWAVARDHRPWLGSGYRAFWIDANTKYFFESFAWSKDLEGNLSDSFAGPTHAHSGYVDLWLETGIVGVASYAVLLLSAFRALSKAIARGAWQVALVFSVICVFLHIYAFSGRSILQQSEDLWFLFTFSYLALIRGTMQVSAAHDTGSRARVLAPVPSQLRHIPA